MITADEHKPQPRPVHEPTSPCRTRGYQGVLVPDTVGFVAHILDAVPCPLARSPTTHSCHQESLRPAWCHRRSRVILSTSSRCLCCVSRSSLSFSPAQLASLATRSYRLCKGRFFDAGIESMNAGQVHRSATSEPRHAPGSWYDQILRAVSNHGETASLAQIYDWMLTHGSLRPRDLVLSSNGRPRYHHIVRGYCRELCEMRELDAWGAASTGSPPLSRSSLNAPDKEAPCQGYPKPHCEISRSPWANIGRRWKPPICLQTHCATATGPRMNSSYGWAAAHPATPDGVDLMEVLHDLRWHHHQAGSYSRWRSQGASNARYQTLSPECSHLIAASPIPRFRNPYKARQGNPDY